MLGFYVVIPVLTRGGHLYPGLVGGKKAVGDIRTLNRNGALNIARMK
jgi:hypothetical protein